MYQSFHPGKVWLDTAGKPIQAHGFSIFYDENEKCWYWIGENKEHTKPGGTVWTWGIRLYRSTDLYNWEDLGLIIPPTPNDLNSPLHPTYCIDRPHVLFCEKTKKYVVWLKIMAGEISQFMCVLQADSLMGPYEMVHEMYKPLKMDTGDFCLWQEDGKAYILYERPHFQLICATLTEDYTAVTGEHSVHYDGLYPPDTREAPTIFKKGGKKYLFTSGTSGYFPNQSRVCVLDDLHGEYTDLGDPCVGDKSNTTFNSQITSVIRVPGTELYIACADRWMPNWWIKPMAGSIISGMKRRYQDYKPDTEPKEIHPLSGVEAKHNENTCNSRYVWLPITWDGDKPTIHWHKQWRWEDFV